MTGLRFLAAAAAAAALFAVGGCAQAPAAGSPRATPALAAAPTPASPASVERMLQAMGAEQMLGGMYGQVGQFAEAMAKQAGIREQDRPAFERYMQRVAEVMQQEAGWAQLKEPMIRIYASHYSEEEIQGLTAFYESPLGRSMVAKTPEVMRDSAAVSQELLKRVMPRLVELAKEMQRASPPAR